jgi:hypothetical protein
VIDEECAAALVRQHQRVHEMAGARVCPAAAAAAAAAGRWLDRITGA